MSIRVPDERIPWSTSPGYLLELELTGFFSAGSRTGIEREDPRRTPGMRAAPPLRVHVNPARPTFISERVSHDSIVCCGILHPTGDQKILIAKLIGHSRFVYLESEPARTVAPSTTGTSTSRSISNSSQLQAHNAPLEPPDSLPLRRGMMPGKFPSEMAG